MSLCGRVRVHEKRVGRGVVREQPERSGIVEPAGNVRLDGIAGRQHRFTEETLIAVGQQLGERAVVRPRPRGSRRPPGHLVAQRLPMCVGHVCLPSPNRYPGGVHPLCAARSAVRGPFMVPTTPAGGAGRRTRARPAPEPTESSRMTSSGCRLSRNWSASNEAAGPAAESGRTPCGPITHVAWTDVTFICPRHPQGT